MDLDTELANHWSLKRVIFTYMYFTSATLHRILPLSKCITILNCIQLFTRKLNFDHLQLFQPITRELFSECCYSSRRLEFPSHWLTHCQLTKQPLRCSRRSFWTFQFQIPTQIGNGTTIPENELLLDDWHH